MLKISAFKIFIAIALAAPATGYAAAPAAGSPRADMAAPNAFAFRQYRALAQQEEGNIFYSPYSVYSAFAMVYEGAKGTTAREIKEAFGFPAELKTLRAGFSGGRRALETARGKNEFSVSNSLWAQVNYKFKTAYINTLTEFYGCEAFNLDFAADPEGERATINAWVEKKTRSKIKELFAANSLNSLTRLVLANAVYFKGSWKNPFPKERTSEGDFFTAPQTPVKTFFMRSGKPFALPYAAQEDVQALELPYEGGTLSMLILLPQGGGLAALERNLTPEKLKELDAALSEEKVNVSLPKFSLGLGYDLKACLRGLGVITAFTELADLSGMDGSRKLFVQKALHKSFIEVNEEGTEAAAATGAAMGLKSIEFPAEFSADRPFLFLIREKKSGLILFMGRYAAPR